MEGIAHHHMLKASEHPYSSSGDDVDSPPSLTNSSESPRSTSEEGGSSSPPQSAWQVDLRHRNSKAPLPPPPSQPNSTTAIDDDDTGNVTHQAPSPNWDSVFGTTADSSEMMDFAPTAATHAVSSMPTEDASDAMFESLIEFGQQNGNEDNDASVAARMTVDTTAAATTAALPSEITPPQSAHPSTSALSSRRNSLDIDAMASQARLQQRIPHSGSHYSHTSDADLPTSSHVVVRPPIDELSGLQVHVHGISFTGAKSRVETQIRLRLELVRPVGEPSVTGSAGFERIGAFNHVKLPPLTGTKRRSKKHKQVDVDAEKTLFMDAAVVRATPPHERVFVCRSCQQREKKRAQRRKSGGGKKEENHDEEQQYTLDDYQELGVDPDALDAREQAKRRSEEEDEKRVVVFNCGDFVAFEEGACILPTRITCYCRHHREKAGFCLIFTMRDFRGNLVATGSTPPIMITDDHKSVAAAAASASAAGTMRRVDGMRSRAGSTEAIEDVSVKTEAGRRSRKAQRSRPYGDADERNARRSNVGLNMTPHTSTGHNTPAVIHSPSASQSDMSQPDFWNAFAAMANVSGGSPPTSSRASTGVQTPYTESTSPLASAQSLASMHAPARTQSVPVPPPQQSSTMQDWVASLAGQGSISAQTLNVGPQSLPGFDLQAFIDTLQRGQREGNQASVQQLLMLARSLPGISLDGTIANSSLTSPTMAQSHNVAPAPSISKLIPGEGPTSGGIEVTVLGENFVEGLTCYFGDVPANSTRVWGSNTLLCILPPSASPGPVAVTVKLAGQHDHSMAERFNHSLQLFTYVDATDRALMELALQVVGLQMTGQMQSARDVAMRVVGSGPNQSMTRAHGSSGSGGGGSSSTGSQHAALSQSRNAVAGLFANTTGNMSFQDSVITFLRTLDVNLGEDASSRRWRSNAIRLANKQGHTLLHLATILGFHRLTLDLIQRGAPVNARDQNGFTALHFAALYGRLTIARSLLSHGARTDVFCEAGLDALDVARAHEEVDLESLLERIAEPLCDVGDSDEGNEDDDQEAAPPGSNSLIGVDESVDGHSGQIDDDNLSSIVDEESEVEQFSSSDGDEDDDNEKDARQERGQHPALNATIAAAAEDDRLRSLEAHTPKEKNVERLSHTADERKAGLKSLVFGGFDFANRPRFGMPNALHGGLPHFHVPVVSVFQMALPPSFTNWTALGTTNSDSSSTPTNLSHDKDRDVSTPSPSTWRDFLEESALWINPLSAPPPPPAYDTLDVPLNGSSRFPAIARSIPLHPASRELNATASAKLPDQRADTAATVTSNARSIDVEPQQPVDAPASHSMEAKHSSTPVRTKPLGFSSSEATCATDADAPARIVTSRHRRITSHSRSLKDDRMLVYFWLPILISVVLLLCFAKPTSVLSFGDLMSFMPF